MDAPLNTVQDIVSEHEKCKNSPYYFAMKYMTINGKPFTTNLTEHQFNLIFHSMEGRSIEPQVMTIKKGAGKGFHNQKNP